MYRDSIIYLGLSKDTFYDLTVAEFNLYMERFKYKKQQEKINLLDQALYISCLVLNKEAPETYDKIFNSIMNPNDKPNKTNNLDYSKEYEEQQKRINEILIAEAKKRGLNTPNT